VRLAAGFEKDWVSSALLVRLAAGFEKDWVSSALLVRLAAGLGKHWLIAIPSSLGQRVASLPVAVCVSVVSRCGLKVEKLKGFGG
jgi:hypothetical protein